MRVSSNLTFDGRCEEAFHFYEKCLGGKITVLMTWGDSPMAEKAPPDWAKKVLHASFAIGDQEINGNDSHPEHYKKPQGFSVVLEIAEVAEAERVFKALSENAEIQMPIQETYWAKRFGMLVDRFGTPWMINCGKAT